METKCKKKKKKEEKKEKKNKNKKIKKTYSKGVGMGDSPANKEKKSI
jgi:hypothetical protein